METLNAQGKSPSRPEARQLVVDIARQRHVEVHGNDRTFHVGTSTYQRFYKQHMRASSADWTTKSRETAATSIRSCISFLASVHAVRKMVAPSGECDQRTLFNCDATVVQILSDSDLSRRHGVMRFEQDKQHRRAPDGKLVRLASPQGRAGFKIFAIVNAMGDVLPAMTAISDKGRTNPMVEVECDLAPACVRGGVLLVTKSRTDPAVSKRAFWHTLRAMVEYRQHTPDITGMPLVLFLDGAADNLTAAMEDDAIDFCRSNRTILVKLPASTTALFQPLDAGPCFLAAKSVVRGLQAQHTPAALSKMYGSVIRVLDARLGKALEVSSDHRKQVLLALAIASMATRQSFTTPCKMESFGCTGISPFSPERALERFAGDTGNISKAQLKGVIEQLSDEFIANGKLTEASYDWHNLPRNRAEKERVQSPTRKAQDELALPQQRAVLLHHEPFLLREQQRRQEAANRKVERAVQRVEHQERRAALAKAKEERA